jgi:SAM-dependent methyltransferase
MPTTHAFAGSMPEYYDHYLGPAWFDLYAQDLARRVPQKPAGNVLEIACGTGLITKRLRERVDPSVELVATDLSPAMLAYARARYAGVAGIEWREADALDLPFGDATFAAVACGFGIMFMPDPTRALLEARRVLRPGGILVFNVWDRIENNPTGLAGAGVLESMFPGDPEMRFRTPFEMYELDLLRKLLAAARFRETRIETHPVAIDGMSAREVATGQVRGTPRSSLIEKRGVPLDHVIDKIAVALTELGGADPYRAMASAIVVEAVAE